MTENRFGPYTVSISNEDKVLFPGTGITKGDLIDYYEAVADSILPHLRDRPLALHRFPDGIEGEGFVQQRVSDHFPDWLDTERVERSGDTPGIVEHPLCNKLATLVYLADQGTVSLHRWLSRRDRLNTPDLLVFDLDPSTDDFGAVVTAAHRVADLMRELGASPYVMTTGSRGLHVVMPLRRDAEFDDVRGVAQDMAGVLADRYPATLTTEHRKRKRGDRLYLDIMRNAYGQTAVAPYSVRARAGAPVATPLHPDELDDPKLRPDGFSISDLPGRLKKRGDPWQGMGRHGVSLATITRALESV